MIHRSSISRFLNNREIKDPQTNRYICRLHGFTTSKCWLASPQTSFGVRSSRIHVLSERTHTSAKLRKFQTFVESKFVPL